MKNAHTFRKAALGAGLVLLSSTGAFADYIQTGPKVMPVSFDRAAYARRDHNPVYVYIDIDSEGRRRAEERFEAETLRAVRHNVPDYVRIIDDRRRADIVVGVRERDYDLDFRVVDRDHEQERYGRVNPRTANGCGPLYMASYTVVKTKAEARGSYSVRVHTDGVGRDREHIRVKADESFKSGQNLRAHTRCSSEPTNRFPNNGVVALFEKSTPAFQNRVAASLRRQTAEELGEKLAHEINENVDDYYASLSHRYAHRGNGHAYGHYKKSHDKWD
ncbi:hypothetical protein [Kordiimonas sp.]|uniref:hypothetical protein n=1 Tax=Kordiimonas sp. TaxID=1970157 RepID=UPI003A927F15